MICLHCIHYDRCQSLYRFKRLQKAVSNGCPHYKDRSIFVELPCKVGDTVYLIHNRYKIILEYCVSEIIISSSHPVLKLLDCTNKMHVIYYDFNTKREAVFFTKERAEQVLKERKSNDYQNLR